MNWFFYIIFNFIFYSFFGWILEEIYSLFTLGYFKEEGFLSIPFKPMYGIAICILILFYYKFKIDNWTFILLCLIVPTAVEFASGYLLKHIFNLQFWCYDGKFLNYKGLICFKFTICWTVLAYFVIKYIQVYIYKFYCIFINANNVIAFLLILYILLDVGNIVRKRYEEIRKFNSYIENYNKSEHIRKNIKNL